MTRDNEPGSVPPDDAAHARDVTLTRGDAAMLLDAWERGADVTVDGATHYPATDALRAIVKQLCAPVPPADERPSTNEILVHDELVVRESTAGGMEGENAGASSGGNPAAIPGDAEELVMEFWRAVSEWERLNQHNDKHPMLVLGAAYGRAQKAYDAVLEQLRASEARAESPESPAAPSPVRSPAAAEDEESQTLNALLFAWLYANHAAMAGRAPVESVSDPYYAIVNYVASRRSPSVSDEDKVRAVQVFYGTGPSMTQNPPMTERMGRVLEDFCSRLRSEGTNG